MAYAVVRYFQSDVEYVARLELVRILSYGWLFLSGAEQPAPPGGLAGRPGRRVVGGHPHIALRPLPVHNGFRERARLCQAFGLQRPRLRHVHLPQPLGGLPGDAPAGGPGPPDSRARGSASRASSRATPRPCFSLVSAVSVSRGGYLAAGLALLLFLGVLLRYRGFRRYVLGGLLVDGAAAAVFLTTANGATETTAADVRGRPARERHGPQ